MRAVVTFGRGWNALAATRSLGRRGIEVVVGDSGRFTPAGFSRYAVATFRYPDPDEDPRGFLDALEDAVRKHRPADGQYALVPIHKETFLIARNKKRFDPWIRTALPTAAQIDQVNDKGTLALYCRLRGIPIPRTEVVESRREAERLSRVFPYPAFVKIRMASSAVGVKKVGDARELLKTFDEFVATFRLDRGSLPILQEAVPGDDYCATFLFDRGRMRAAMTYHNLRSFPARSGTGVLRETVRARAIQRIGAGILSRLGWHGVAEIDFRWQGGNSEPKLIEINPRFWGGLPQAVAAGWDYPYLLYRLAVEGRVPRVRPHDSAVRTEAPLMGVLATLQEIAETFKHGRSPRAPGLKGLFETAAGLKTKWSRIKALISDHRGAISDVFSWEDPLPALGVLHPLAVLLKHGRLSTALLVGEKVGS